MLKAKSQEGLEIALGHDSQIKAYHDAGWNIIDEQGGIQTLIAGPDDTLPESLTVRKSQVSSTNEALRALNIILTGEDDG